jgi:L-fuculose-phosphate aldolase
MSSAAELVFVYRELARLGMNTGSSGNVSVRHGDGMLITPSRTTAATVAEGSLVEMGLDGTSRRNHRPSSEWSMHAAIYAAAPEAAVIVHTHADACSALSCLNRGLPPFHYMVLAFGGEDVRCAAYATFGTPALAALAQAAIAGRSACLLANHGMICHGRTAQEALSGAILLETLARQYLLALSAGTPRLLTETELAEARERFRSY